jgi:hypothetical protein
MNWKNELGTLKIKNKILEIFEFIKKSLSEDNGKPSSMRMMVFFSHFQWTLSITFGFIVVLFSYPAIIIEYLIVIAGLVAGLLGLKKWQKADEKPGVNMDPKPADENT